VQQEKNAFGYGGRFFPVANSDVTILFSLRFPAAISREGASGSLLNSGEACLCKSLALSLEWRSRLTLFRKNLLDQRYR
jgi:hypothetical protein